jgi:hypothetical protein
MNKICIPIPSSTVVGVSSTPLTTPSVNIFRVEPSITNLTGGTSTDLDGIATSTGDYPVGICIFLVISGVPHIYQLVAGTATESSPSVILPDDYSVSLNAKYWIQRM